MRWEGTFGLHSFKTNSSLWTLYNRLWEVIDFWVRWYDKNYASRKQTLKHCPDAIWLHYISVKEWRKQKILENQKQYLYDSTRSNHTEIVSHKSCPLAPLFMWFTWSSFSASLRSTYLYPVSLSFLWLHSHQSINLNIYLCVGEPRWFSWFSI